ncbi:hypothetical protein BAE44_0023017 [Dichanthelium oligosanthes]|uniref:DUF1618 domain-containing protein n=1 Tax=Dichanthelium oligosanthes TaxID=888268 RepID=A0A1E5UT12_9POAL|nr:hypothetical protein BAE44_0023017 [Dichanthelium oligosanthes]
MLTAMAFLDVNGDGLGLPLSLRQTLGLGGRQPRRATPPPIYPDDLGPPPESILLDTDGYLSNRTNATTAEGLTKAGKRITVTFWAAHPPRASCFTVHAPDLDPSAFGDVPTVLTTEDDLALLRVPICHPCSVINPSCDDYFVYQAGDESKGPSLDLIPKPPPVYCSDYQVGLLRCRVRDIYFVAILRWAVRKGEYDLYLYSSETGTWGTKLMYLASRQEFKFIRCTKVITIGGELGSIGWVDLSLGILICDILLDNHELRYIPLQPSPAVPKRLGQEDGRRKAWVVAVDMRNHTLKGVADYDCGRLVRYNFFWGSGISKHLRRTSSASGRVKKVLDKLKARGGTSKRCRHDDDDPHDRDYDPHPSELHTESSIAGEDDDEVSQHDRGGEGEEIDIHGYTAPSRK